MDSHSCRTPQYLLGHHSFFVTKAEKAKADPLLKYIETVLEQLGKVAENSEKYNLEFGKYQQVIQDLTQNQVPQMVALSQGDSRLKQEDIARQQKLDVHLENLTTEIITLRQEDIARQQKLEENFQTLIEAINRQSNVLEQNMQHQSTSSTHQNSLKQSKQE